MALAALPRYRLAGRGATTQFGGQPNIPTSWNVTPHRYEHGKPVMTGDKWKVLDLNDECVVNECEGIVENLGAAWIRARLDFYGRWLDQLFGPSESSFASQSSIDIELAWLSPWQMAVHRQGECGNSSR